MRPTSTQALSKRVHYGKFVAEAKFLAQREEYSDLIRRQDSGAIMGLLTNKAVEQQVWMYHIERDVFEGKYQGFAPGIATFFPDSEAGFSEFLP